MTHDPNPRRPSRNSRLAVFARAVSLPAFALALSCGSVGGFAQAPTPPAPPAPVPESPAPAAPPAAESPKPDTAAPVPGTTVPLPDTNKRKSQAAADAFLNGARFLDRRNLAGAEAQFAKAVSLNPHNAEYAQALALTREHHLTDLVQQASKARLLGHNDTAETLLAQARAIDPQNPIITQHADAGPLPPGFIPTLDPAHVGIAYTGPITLLPSEATQSFHLRANVQDVISSVAGKFGIRTVFDTSVTPQSLRFDLDNTRYNVAMPILLDMSRLFAVPLDAHSVFIAKDTLENRQRLERLLEETIYIPALTQEQMTELSNVVRNIFDLKQVTIQTGLGSMVVRAPESIMSALNYTLADLIDGGSEVLLDLKLYTVDKTRTRNIGAQLPQQIGLYNVQGAAHDLVTANQSTVDQAIAQGLIPAGSSDITIALALIASGVVQSALLSNTLGFVGGGLTATGITTNANPTFTLSLNSSDTRVLDDVQLRMGDRQSSTFRAGSRYPITTSTYTVAGSTLGSSALAGVSIGGVSAASLLANNSLTVPQISFEDLGVTLKATSTVQKTNNVTVHIDFKIEALSGSSINNIPTLNSRQFTSDITIADGQTALMVSAVSKQESGAINGLPALSELPGFQTATADKTTVSDTSDLILLITPHIVRRRSNVISGPRIAVNLPATPE
ncbi:hypothetical protein [Granulicella sp. dw_53]|uniref:hypothetical protein n=1 Tax=Granulicella sp. dw_53 TaxID=2719792 RepID=UPI001BD256EA|nr:hypothetical protein [Granulicella sp. dw_53]